MCIKVHTLCACMCVSNQKISYILCLVKCIVFYSSHFIINMSVIPIMPPAVYAMLFSTATTRKHLFSIHIFYKCGCVFEKHSPRLEFNSHSTKHGSVVDSAMCRSHILFYPPTSHTHADIVQSCIDNSQLSTSVCSGMANLQHRCSCWRATCVYACVLGLIWTIVWGIQAECPRRSERKGQRDTHGRGTAVAPVHCFKYQL